MAAYLTESPKQRGGLVRQALEFVVCLTIAVLIYRSWYVEGYIVPTGSMATTLLGMHRQATCADCGYPFAVGTDAPLPTQAVCPNCGYPDNPLDVLPNISGDRLLVRKNSLSTQSPQRWDVIVFQHPQVSHKAYIKRVAGLPGESVQIHRGDLYVDGHIQRKTLDQQRAVSVNVFDNHYRPRADSSLPPRWQGGEADTLWKPDGDGFVHPDSSQGANAAQKDPPVDWLVYRHWRRVPGRPSRVEEVPITDNCGYNQHVSRVLNHASDLMLRCHVKASGPGSLWWRISDGRDQLMVRFDPATGDAWLWHNEQLVHKVRFPLSIPVQGALFELSQYDRQFLMAIDEELVFKPYEYEESMSPYRPTSRPVAIGASRLAVEISDLQLLRDVYYTQPTFAPHPWAIGRPYQLGDDEYFVLGDNSPLSEDSRAWEDSPAVPEELLVGRPIVVHIPSRRAVWGSLQLQIPDTNRIRYIR